MKRAANLPCGLFALVLAEVASAETIDDASVAPRGPEPEAAASAPEPVAESAADPKAADPNAADSSVAGSNVADPNGTDANVAAPSPVEPKTSDASVAPEPSAPDDSSRVQAPAEADPPLELEIERARERTSPPSPFDRNRVRVGARAGWAGGSTTDWFVLGVGVGYFLATGLEVGVDGDFWLGGDPFIATVTPGVRYVLHMVPDVKPYLGVFYRHYFVDRSNFDSDAIGGRAGVYFLLSDRVTFGGGLVYEHLLDDRLFRVRDQVYPEISFAVTF